MNIIKLSDERVREILSNPDADVHQDELHALAQAVLDLRTANAMLEAALESTATALASANGWDWSKGVI